MRMATPMRGMLAALFSISALTGAAAHADTYPSKPITLVVGYPAGGSVDLTARILSEELSSRLGKSIIVENAGGAGGTIGAQRVVRSTADGYTLLLGSTNEMVIAGMINQAVRYDGQKDFTPIGIIASQPMLLAASKKSGINSAAHYLKSLKSSEANHYSFGSSGVGTALHLAGEMVNEATGTSSLHVPYRGVAPLVSDLISGQLDLAYLVLSSGLPQVKAGAIVPLGITEKQRSQAAPDIPALAETPGFEKVDINVWFALYGPANLPEPVLSKLRSALDESLQSATLRDRLSASGATLYKPGLDPVAFQGQEVDKYARLVKLANIQPE